MFHSKHRTFILFITALCLFITKDFARPIHPYYKLHQDFGSEPALRTILNTSYDGKTLKLNDGSMWTISSYADQKELSSWVASDPVFFMKESWPWCNSGTYKILNLSNRIVINADLSQNGYTNVASSYSVYAITSKNTLILKTGNNRLVLFEARNANEENRYIQNWSIGDTIIVGRNHFPTSGECHSHILVNYKANDYNVEYIQARYLGYIQN